METTPSHFMVSVKDMERSLDFYQNKLGLKILYQTAEWSELSFNDNLELALKKVDEANNLNNAGIGFQVKDCEGATKHYESLGVEIVTRCQKKDDLILTQFKDPDGNMIWLAQKIK
ncbi:MAG: VOC family protein [Patescibacteria group bacterium]